ncbi:hypothetical protein ACFL6N_04730 [Thermodesulfobacteriota bacterium]
MKPLINTQEFLALSSFLNYQLAGEPVNWQGILNILFEEPLDEDSEEFLTQALEYLGEGYGQQKRRLGPLAILHPIRAAALLAKVQVRPNTLDLLTALLHDKDEDLTVDHYSPEDWQLLEKRYGRLLEKIDSNANWFLNERIAFLAKEEGQKYTDYLGRLLEHAKETPELAAIKLADRLDNTLDLRIDLHDITDKSHSFQIIFDILFANSYQGLKLPKPHPISRKINGSMRLYQLYKNAVFLSMLRSENILLGEDAGKLFYSLAVAGIREAQTIMLHIFAYHLRDPAIQRVILLEAMEYSHRGGFEHISEEGGSALDGIFRKYFVHESPEIKKSNLAALYQDKKLMGLVAVAFLIIFANFINNDEYLIKGISSDGIIPV